MNIHTSTHVHPSIRLIALDLDGTLLNPEGRVSPPNLAALRAAAAEGIEIVIATGRRHTYALHVLRVLGLSPATPLISSNGAVVRTFASELIERTLMDPASARSLCAHLGDLRNALVLTFDKLDPQGNDVRGALVVEELEDLHASIGRWMATNEPYIAHIRPIEDALRDQTPIQMMLCGTIARMRDAESHMLQLPDVAAVGETRPHARISLNRTEYPARNLSLVDILPAGCSKGNALLRLAAQRNILPAEIMAIGDNWNDLSMLEVAGLPVLMSNAPEDFKNVARQRQWLTCPSNEADGVAEAILHLLTPYPTALSNSKPNPQPDLLSQAQTEV